MEMCLYYPALGYYSSANERIGSSGDFFTSPGITPLFGELIATQIEEMWEIMERKPFTILEYGAGPGELCRDILQALKKNIPLYRELRYCIIEKSAGMREKEREILHEKVSWHQQIDDIPDLTGCVLSNELIDNFPVHLVVRADDGLKEVFVDYQDGFTEILMPAAGELKSYFAQLGVSLPEGYRTEINLDALQWIREIAHSLIRGFVVTIDYGSAGAGLYSEKRRNGTLMCYHRHTMNDNPYQHIGQQDITSHVNFSALVRWGGLYGLKCAGLTHQAHFLQALGLTGRLQKMETKEPGARISGKARIIHRFLMGLGTRLKVLIQQKGVVASHLSGLQFSQPYS
jgi:SAM-dependent MidA family methyltransferase